MTNIAMYCGHMFNADAAAEAALAERIDAAIAEPHRAAEVVEQLGLVGHHQYGHAAIGVHGGEELHHQPPTRNQTDKQGDIECHDPAHNRNQGHGQQLKGPTNDPNRTATGKVRSDHMTHL